MQSTSEKVATILRFFHHRGALESYEVDPPATSAQIVAAEKKLGLPFPDILRQLYLACGGFAANSGVYLSPLFGDHGIVRSTLFARTELSTSYIPINTTHWLVFGNDGCGNDWILRLSDNPPAVGTYNYECDNEFVKKSNDLLGFYLARERRWIRVVEAPEKPFDPKRI